MAPIDELAADCRGVNHICVAAAAADDDDGGSAPRMAFHGRTLRIERVREMAAMVVLVMMMMTCCGW